jgi:hypothetical protein
MEGLGLNDGARGVNPRHGVENMQTETILVTVMDRRRFMMYCVILFGAMEKVVRDTGLVL